MAGASVRRDGTGTPASTPRPTRIPDEPGRLIRLAGPAGDPSRLSSFLRTQSPGGIDHSGRRTAHSPRQAPSRRARIPAVYFAAMTEDQNVPCPPPASSSPSSTDRSGWPVWSGRVGDPEPKADYSSLTPSERVELCWEVTKQAWALSGALLDESAFCRDSASVSRGGR